MNIYVLNEQFQKTSIIDVYESFIWTDRYYESGDFELVVPASIEMVSILQKDLYLSIDSSENTMIIEDIEITTDYEKGNELKVTGRTLDSILDRRIIWGQTELNGNLQNAIKTLLEKNVINPEEVRRKIDNFVFKETTDPTIIDLTIDAQYFGDNLYDTIVALCKANFIGFRVTLNSTNQMVFELYSGVDRTFNQTEREAIEFSPRFDNLLNSDYVRSDKSLKNVALVGGEGEGSERKTSSVYTTAGLGVLNLDIQPSGLKRREMFSDANSISSKVTDGDGHQVNLSDAEYTEKLNHKGMQDLAEVDGITTFNGEVNSYIQSIYKRDYYLGDLVQIKNEYNIEGTTRIIEVIYSDNTSDGKQIYPTFKSDDSESWSGTAVIDGDFRISGALYTNVLRVDKNTLLKGNLETYTKMENNNGVMTSGIELSHDIDYITWKNSSPNKTFPLTYGGLHWTGQSDSISVTATENSTNNFQLNIKFGDDDSNGLSILDASDNRVAQIDSHGRAWFNSLIINGKEYTTL